jgi:hypothetical protein
MKETRNRGRGVVESMGRKLGCLVASGVRLCCCAAGFAGADSEPEMAPRVQENAQLCATPKTTRLRWDVKGLPFHVEQVREVEIRRLQ